MRTAQNFALHLDWKFGKVQEIPGRFPILGQGALEKGFVLHKDLSLTTMIGVSESRRSLRNLAMGVGTSVLAGM